MAQRYELAAAQQRHDGPDRKAAAAALRSVGGRLVAELRPRHPPPAMRAGPALCLAHRDPAHARLADRRQYLGLARGERLHIRASTTGSPAARALRTMSAVPAPPGNAITASGRPSASICVFRSGPACRL